MYYRRKVILALLESFNGELGKISFQKLLFLFTRHQEKPAFDFVPYNYGCFSFQSYADMHTMIKYNMISEEKEKWSKADKVNYTVMLTPKDKLTLIYIKNKFGKSTKEELIEYTYKNYPFYALKSSIAKNVLNKTELKTVKDTVLENNETILYTIGYEGISLETYLNKLILNNVKMLCDVRKNSISMKYGFSKSQLQKACENLDIKYLHIPDLGIDSDKRQSLNFQIDYDRLFKEYAITTLVAKKTTVRQVLDILESNKRIALTCFEAHECQCHRGTLAKAITQLPEWKYELKHL